jgi:uncharacterized membrane protein YebE (DUF533 family)
MAIKLPTQAFVALAAVGWADGRIHATEGQGLVRAAREGGLTGDDLAAVEASTREKVALDAFDPGAMTEWERVATYALASWLAQIDGVVSTDEGDTLADLGQRLALDAALRRRATAAAFDISVLPEGGRPDKYDFVKLVVRLRERMPGLAGAP